MTKPKTPKMKSTNGWAVVDRDGDVWKCFCSGRVQHDEHAKQQAQEVARRMDTSINGAFAPFTVVHVTITQRKERK
jgi:hypothetical protein